MKKIIAICIIALTFGISSLSIVNAAPGGGKNAQHASQAKRDAAKAKYIVAKAKYEDLKSTPMKTPAIKKKMASAKKAMDKAKKDMDFTGENHSQKAKR